MNVMVEMLSNTSVIVSWESIDTSEPTISYRVYYYYNQSGDMDAFVNASSNSIVIDNLTSIVEYLFYVVVIAEVDGQILIGRRSMTLMIVAVSTTECMLCYHDWLIITIFNLAPGSTTVGIIVGVILLIISIAIVTVLAIFLGFWFKRYSHICNNNYTVQLLFCKRQNGKPDKNIAVGYAKPRSTIVTIPEHTSGSEGVLISHYYDDVSHDS